MAAHPELAHDPLVAGWAQAGWPLIVRRSACADDGRMIPLGLPLPPAQGKRRIALAVALRQIARLEPPPLLAQAAASAPRHWRPTIERLVRLDPQTRTFGGLAWEHLTGLAYLSAASDLDLLWTLPSPDKAAALLEGVAEIAGRAPMRIDGEVLGPAGGVQWRELLAAADGEVLLKATAEVRTVSRAAFLAGAGC